MGTTRRGLFIATIAHCVKYSVTYQQIAISYKSITFHGMKQY